MLRRQLDSGLTILAHRNAAAPAVAIQVWVCVGSADEVAGEHGLAHVHEHMLFKGTQRRGVGRIASEIEGAGGDINAFTSYDHTVYHVVMSSRFFDVGLDVLADAVQHSAFDAGELSRELEVVLEEIKRGEDSAPRVAARALFATAFDAHPYGRPVIGTSDSVRALSRDAVLTFYRRWYTAANIVVVAVGDLDEEDAARRIAGAFGDLERGERPVERTPEPPLTTQRFTRVESRFEQTHLHLAFPAPPAAHEDVAALDVLALVLGLGESSRLREDVKRGAALVNDASAWAWTPRDRGLFVVSATLPKGDARPARAALLEQIARIRDEPIREDELKKALRILESQRVYGRESVAGQARKYGYYETTAGGWQAEEAYLARVREATVESLHAVAQRALDPSRMVTAALVSSDGVDELAEVAPIGAG